MKTKTYVANNIKMDVVEIGWGAVGIALAQNRDKWIVLVNVVIRENLKYYVVMNLLVP
jgi:hypothetical protein